MSDPLHQLAAAVATHVNGGSYSASVDARLRYLPSFELRELSELQVSVTPRALVRAVESRQADRLEAAVDLAVMQRCDPDDQAQVAALMQLVHQLEDRVNRQRLDVGASGGGSGGGSGGAVWVRTERDPVFLADALAEQRVFTSILTLIYRMHD